MKSSRSVIQLKVKKWLLCQFGCRFADRQNKSSDMSRLRVGLLLILIIGSSLAETDNEEEPGAEGTEAEGVEGQGTETEVTEAEVTEAEFTEPQEDRMENIRSGDKQEQEEHKDKEVGDSIAENNELKGKDLKDKDLKDKSLKDKDLKHKAAKADEEVEDPRSEDKQMKNRAEGKKVTNTRAKQKRIKDKRVKAHQKATRNKQLEFDEEDDSMEDDNSAYDESDEDDYEEILTRATCMNGLRLPKLRSLCCHDQMILDKDLDYCLENGEVISSYSRNKNKSLRIALNIIECVYRKKKYITYGDRLNVRRIQADAAKLGDPVQAEFMTKMYKTCGRVAKQAVKGFKLHRREIPMDFHSTHEVFVFAVYLCVDKYLQEYTCPYFQWFGKTAVNDATCLAYAKKCKKLMM